MAMGRRSTFDFASLAGIDYKSLALLKTNEGTTYDAIVRDMSAGVRAFNGESNSFLMGLAFGTTDRTYTERQGSMVVETHTELRPSRPQRGGAYVHSLPMESKEISLGWTWDYVRKARQSQIDTDISISFDAWRDWYEKQTLMRLFAREDVTVLDGGVSPGFVGGGSHVYAPNPYNGKSFANHQHYVAVAGATATDWATQVAAAEKNLMEHGHVGPFDLLISEQDEAVVRTVSTFIARPPDNVILAVTTSAAIVSDEYIGMIGRMRIKVHYRVPQGYAAAYKSYGPDNPRNPLRWVYQEDNGGFGDGIVILAGDTHRDYPIENAIEFRELGIGVGDRTGAVLLRFGNASYVTPVIQ